MLEPYSEVQRIVLVSKSKCSSNFIPQMSYCTIWPALKGCSSGHMISCKGWGEQTVLPATHKLTVNAVLKSKAIMFSLLWSTRTKFSDWIEKPFNYTGKKHSEEIHQLVIGTQVPEGLDILHKLEPQSQILDLICHLQYLLMFAMYNRRSILFTLAF